MENTNVKNTNINSNNIKNNNIINNNIINNNMNDTNIDTIDQTIFIFDAKDGMVLSKNVLSADGSLIVKKNTVLNHELISKISSMHILEINVLLPIEDNIPESVETLTYYDNVRKSETFHQFQASYFKNVELLKTSLNDIVTNKVPINPTQLLKSTSELLSRYRNNLQLFDMLHCMREFDDSTYMHCLNVALIASIIGKWLNYPQKEIDLLTLCGLLHDIGKLSIPSSILTKPGMLTENEFEIMKNHVNLGYAKLRDEDIDVQIKAACLLHHEKCDGTGYPFHLHSEQIPDFSKIITIADVYDAMTANRVYRRALCPFTVIKQMEEDAYTKYDPRFILPFLQNVVGSYVNTNVKLSDGRKGQVIMLNNTSLSRPVIQINNKFIDLAKEQGLYISAVI